MENVLGRLSSGARVVVIRLRSLGDCVLTTPALEILKKARPDAEIAVVVEDRFAAVFEGNPNVSQIVGPGAAGVRRLGAELVLNLHGGTRSMALTAASGARYRAGFAHFRGGALYNVKIPRAQEILGEERVVHTAEHLASAIFHLGAERQEIPRARLYAEARGGGPAYAVIHPVASAPDKTWPAKHFLAVAGHLAEDWKLEPVFVAAPWEDMSAFAGYRVAAGAPLSEVKELIAGASLFVGNDSGPAHMAAALGAPLAVVFGNSELEIWRPWKAAAAEVLANRENIAAVGVDEMIEAIGRLRVRA